MLGHPPGRRPSIGDTPEKRQFAPSACPRSPPGVGRAVSSEVEPHRAPTGKLDVHHSPLACFVAELADLVASNLFCICCRVTAMCVLVLNGPQCGRVGMIGRPHRNPGRSLSTASGCGWGPGRGAGAKHALDERRQACNV